MQNETFLAIYKQLRQYLEHEDDLINARISRSMLLHGFLLAAYSLLVQAITDVMSKPIGVADSKCLKEQLGECLSSQLSTLILMSENLTTLISLLGLLAAIGTILGVHAGNSSISRLTGHCKSLFEENEALVRELNLPVIAGGGSWLNKFLGCWSTNFLPYTALALWAIIFLNTVTPNTVKYLILFVTKPLAMIG